MVPVAKRKIALLSSNISSNCMYRTLLLYRALEPHYQVEVIGFDVGGGLWSPIGNEKFNIASRPLNGWFSLIKGGLSLLRSLRSDVVIASKARLPSYGLALLNRLIRGTPVILDVDDDERAMTRPPPTASTKTVLLYNLLNPDAYYSTKIMHFLVKRADGVFCVSEHFRSLYGGVIIPHGLKPHSDQLERSKVDELRSKLGLENSFVVVFMGTPRPHKGIGETLEAARLSGISNIKVLVVGASAGDSYLLRLESEYMDLLATVGPQPRELIPYFLALGNVTVLAQARNSESVGQMPAKLTDSMFAGLPIIATKIADIPVYLDGCGLLIDEPDPQLIAESLVWVHENPEAARELGQKARKVACDRLSDAAIARAMIDVIEKIAIRQV